MQLGSSCVLAPLATNVDLWKPIFEGSIGSQQRQNASFTNLHIIILHFASV